MGKKIAIVTVLLLVFFAFNYLYKNTGNNKDVLVSTKSPSATISPVTVSKKTSSIFVPYWADFKTALELNDYDRVIYFGISPTLQGYNEDEIGYSRLGDFTIGAGDKEKFLTIRMIDTDTNLNILQNKKSWAKIINDSLDIAEEYKFNGIVLDLEISSLPFADTMKDINAFVQDFYTQTKARNLYFAITLYGDTFYRKRTYDVKFLSENSDEVMIMAYDLHKARGEPGPNFPLKGKEKYGYDYEALLNDFFIVSPEKISVIFGMYGYDWIVDEKKRPIKPASSLSFLEIKKKFIDNCEWKNCVVLRDRQSAETEVNYIDEQSLYHIVWFEDPKSTADKKNFLEKKGVKGIIYWAYGYF